VIALDATYSVGRNLSGIAVYSREILFGLARQHPEEQFNFYYRPHRILRSLRDRLPGNASRQLLRGAPEGRVFHALNQRVDLPGKRTVTTFHDLFVMTEDYSTPEFRQKFAAQAHDAAKRSDLMIAISQFTARQVEQLLGVERSRIRVIPHGVNLPEKPGTAERRNIVLTVGAIQRRKNILELVRAFERMPKGWRLVLAGATDGFGANEILDAIEESPRYLDIDVLGYVSGARLEKLYASARIFAFPSLDEGFGMPVLDAMAHGVPVIAARRSAIPEVAGDAALLFDPVESEELRDALLRLANDESLRADLIQRGHARAREFPWDAAVKSTWAVYEELQ
jgi:glycosyltransferase involved in cell wall biosynthesis